MSVSGWGHFTDPVVAWAGMARSLHGSASTPPSCPLNLHPEPLCSFALEAQRELMNADWPAEILASSEGCEMWAVPKAAFGGGDLPE